VARAASSSNATATSRRGLRREDEQASSSNATATSRRGLRRVRTSASRARHWGRLAGAPHAPRPALLRHGAGTGLLVLAPAWQWSGAGGPGGRALRQRSPSDRESLRARWGEGKGGGLWRTISVESTPGIWDYPTCAHAPLAATPGSLLPGCRTITPTSSNPHQLSIFMGVHAARDCALMPSFGVESDGTSVRSVQF